MISISFLCVREVIITRVCDTYLGVPFGGLLGRTGGYSLIFLYVHGHNAISRKTVLGLLEKTLRLAFTFQSFVRAEIVQYLCFLSFKTKLFVSPVPRLDLRNS